MFGGVRAQAYRTSPLPVRYFGTIPKPENIKLYTPFNNRECLHCHLGARSFEQVRCITRLPACSARSRPISAPAFRAVASRFVHNVATLKDDTFWKEKQ